VWQAWKPVSIRKTVVLATAGKVSQAACRFDQINLTAGTFTGVCRNPDKGDWDWFTRTGYTNAESFTVAGTIADGVWRLAPANGGTELRWVTWFDSDNYMQDSAITDVDPATIASSRIALFGGQELDSYGQPRFAWPRVLYPRTITRVDVRHKRKYGKRHVERLTQSLIVKPIRRCATFRQYRQVEDGMTEREVYLTLHNDGRSIGYAHVEGHSAEIREYPVCDDDDVIHMLFSDGRVVEQDYVVL
jgi:hypothetical protein